jgi:hypothetical protein
MLGLEDLDQIKLDTILFGPIIPIFQHSNIPYDRAASGCLIKEFNIFALGV